ncbi:UNVERIFIED_CONTAM: hypothetical protein GTU68_038579 [Idotea baltica]|nr:hypothetical protein [Idotea baltica]
MKPVFNDLQSRGCIHDISHPEEIEKILSSEKLSFYCGFDPTADSLHVGSMLPLILMRRLQNAGHTPIALLGTATGMIGDPSGKSAERVLLTQEVIDKNAKGIEKQIKLFLSDKGPNAFTMVRNDSWLGPLSLVDFLRDVGKHFSVNAMMAKESVKNRLENREQGISYTEFSYMLLQAYDFYWLNKNMNCRLQVGGSDQWGNITAGLELLRRMNDSEAEPSFGFTFPLLTTSSGAKFGKTEAGAVWLDPKRTSPYRFYQYWKNTEDADVISYLQLFTEVSSDELEKLKTSVTEAPHKREAQTVLAELLTTLVHGEKETQRAVRATDVLFGGSIKEIVPSTEIEKASVESGIPIIDLLIQSGVSQSKGAARRSIEGGGIYLNNEKVMDSSAKITMANAIENSVIILRSGKKSYHLVQIETK